MPTAAKKKDEADEAPEGMYLAGKVQSLEIRQKVEPLMVNDWGTGTGSAANVVPWNNWNATVTFDTTSATVTQNVYRVWVNGKNDVGWTAGTGDDYRAYRHDNAWRLWTSNDITTGTLSNVTWQTWNDGFEITPARVVPIGAPAVHTRQETEEERIARETREVQRRAEYERRERERQERYAKEQAEKKVINGRAEQLLMSLMNEEQRRDWIASGQFFLIKDDRRYRIKRGSHGNVELVDDKNVVLESFCALPRGNGGELPVADTVAGQLLALRFDEESFVKTAASTMRKQGHKRLKDRLKEHGHLRLAA